MSTVIRLLIMASWSLAVGQEIDGIGVQKILAKGSLSPQLQDLEPLLSQIIERSQEEINCLAVFHDWAYAEVFGNTFFTQLTGIPTFVVQIKETEDLLAPNYGTLKSVKAVRRGGCRVCVILIKNGVQVGRFLRFVDKHRQLDTRANFVIMQDRDLFDPSLHYLWKKIINVIFIRKFATRPGFMPWYDLATVPFPSPIPEVLTLRRLDTWRGGIFKQNTILFRDKTYNLRGQTLRVATFQHVPAAFKIPAPAVKADVTLEGDDPIGFGGMEIEVLATLSRKMNFETFVYEVSEQWGQETANGSYSGLIGEVANGHADLALGDLHHTPHNLKYMDLTIPYNTQCLTFLTPEALTDNSWQTLILPFKGYLWAGVLITLVVGSLTFYALASFYERMEKPENNKLSKSDRKVLVAFEPDITTKHEGLYQFSDLTNSLLYTYSMLLNVSLPKLPTGWSLRVLTGCWWLYSILLVVAYRASMTAILANPAPRVTIDTLEQLADSKITVGGWGEQIKKFFQTSLDSAGKKIGSKFEIVKDVDEAVARVATENFAYYENIYFLQHASVRRLTLTRAEHKKTNNTEQKNERNIHIMNNCVINMPISLGLQKNSPLKPRVDRCTEIHYFSVPEYPFLRVDQPLRPTLKGMSLKKGLHFNELGKLARYLQLVTQAGLVQKWLHDAMSQVLRAGRASGTESQKALMDLKKFLGALVALGAGYAISCVCFLVEITYWHVTVARHPNYDPYSKRIHLTKKRRTREPSELSHH